MRVLAKSPFGNDVIKVTVAFGIDGHMEFRNTSRSSDPDVSEFSLELCSSGSHLLFVVGNSLSFFLLYGLLLGQRSSMGGRLGFFEGNLLGLNGSVVFSLIAFFTAASFAS